MSLVTNGVGNYTPYGVRKTVQTNQQVNQSHKTINEVNKEEKKFFAKLYPDKKEDIIEYHFYKSTGKLDGVSLGSLVDKRG